MTEPTDHTLAPLRRMDAKLGRLQADVTDLRGRLERVEGRLSSLDARLGVLETFDGEVTRLDYRLDEHGRRLARIEAATVLAEPPELVGLFGEMSPRIFRIWGSAVNDAFGSARADNRLSIIPCLSLGARSTGNCKFLEGWRCHG